MDEIKETKGDSPQEAGKAPPGGDETTPKKEAKTHTEKEKDRAVQVALIKAGRDAKSFEQREAAVKAREDATKAEQERREAAELAEAQGDPDRLAVYQSKQAERQRGKSLDEREAELNRSKAEHDAEIQVAKEAQKEINVWQVASAKNIDPVRLKDLSEKFNVEGKEKLEELAEEIATGKPEREPTEPLTPDSAVTSGGQGEPTQEQLEKYTVAQYAAYVEKRDAKK